MFDKHERNNQILLKNVTTLSKFEREILNFSLGKHTQTSSARGTERVTKDKSEITKHVVEVISPHFQNM